MNTEHVTPEPQMVAGKFVDDMGVEHPTREAYDAYVKEAARVAAIASGEAAGDNNPIPQTKAKYVPTTTDVEAIKLNLKSSLSDMNREATKLESRGIPYLLSLCDYAVTHRVDRMEWPDKEKLRKFLRDSGAEPDKTASTYTKTIVNQAVALTKGVTMAGLPIYLGYRYKVEGKLTFAIDKPDEDSVDRSGKSDEPKITRTLLAPDKVISPKKRAGKEMIDNTNEQLVPITFNVANKILTRLTKGEKQRQPNAGTGSTTPTAVMADTIKSYGPDKLCEAMAEFIASKETVPTRENIAAPFELATAVMGKVNAAYPDRIPANMLTAILALKVELDERFELLAEGADAGKYRVVSVDGLNSYTVDPETLPE